MKRLIVNADDFGFCESVNYGIYHAFKYGIVSSTTIMANMPGFEHAIELARENPDLPIGVHMNITCHKPLLDTHKTLVNENGVFSKQIQEYDLEEVYQEFKAQIEKVKSTGIPITHLDSHHHVHTQEYLRPVMEKLLQEYALPVRGGFQYSTDYEKKTSLFGKFYQQNVSKEFLEDFLVGLDENEVYDMMCHPAFLDKILLNKSSYTEKRLEELEVLTSKQVKDYLAKYEVELVNYHIFER